MTADKTTTPERIWAFEDYPGQGAVPRSGMWCDEQSETPEGSPCYIRSDLCASGQVRALTRAAGDESKAGWIVSFDDLQAIRAAAGDWGYGIDLEAVEAIALDVERRILAALTPAPQPEGQVMDGWVDDKTFIEPVSPAATPTAQDAVPVDDELDEAWKDGFNAGFGEAKLTTNPPQPNVSVAEALEAMLHAVCGETGFAACVRHDSGSAYPWPALDAAEEKARSALRALKGDA